MKTKIKCPNCKKKIIMGSTICPKCNATIISNDKMEDYEQLLENEYKRVYKYNRVSKIIIICAVIYIILLNIVARTATITLLAGELIVFQQDVENIVLEKGYYSPEKLKNAEKAYVVFSQHKDVNKIGQLMFNTYFNATMPCTWDVYEQICDVLNINSTYEEYINHKDNESFYQNLSDTAQDNIRIAAQKKGFTKNNE